MKISNNLIKITLSLTFIVITNFAHSLDVIKRFQKDTIDLDLFGSYYSSKSNYYSNSGGASALPLGGRYQLIDTGASLRATFGTQLAAYISTNISNSQADGYNSIDGYYKKTNSSLNNLQLGLEFLINLWGFEFIPEASYLIPFESYDFNSRDVMNSEGVQVFTGKLTVQKEFSSLKTFGSLGFSYRGGGRSGLLPWEGGAEYKFSKYAFGGSVSGFNSVIDDVDASNDSARRQQSLDINGGSFKYGSANPMSIDGNLWFRFKISSIMSKVYASSSLSGGNYSVGSAVGVLFRYTWETPSFIKKSESTPLYKEPTKSDEDLLIESHQKKFHEDTQDGVDQNNFKSKALTPAPENVKLNGRKEMKSQSVSDQDSGYQIQLKPAKKKKKVPSQN